MSSPTPRNPREVVSIGPWVNVDDPTYGKGAYRDVELIDGTTERRFFYHGTGDQPGTSPDAGHLISRTVDPEVRALWERGNPPQPAAPTPDEARAQAAQAGLGEQNVAQAAGLNAERDRHAAAGHGRVTDAEWRAELIRQEQEARAQGNQEAANRLAEQRLQFDREREAQRAREAGQVAAISGQEEISKGTGPGGVDQRIVRDPTTRQITGYAPIPGAEPKEVLEPLPPGVPRFTPDLTRVDLGLSDRRAQLEDLIRQGLIDKRQALLAMTADEGTAKAAGANAGAIVNIQEGVRQADLTARGQDITDASSRRSFAGSTYNQTLSTLAPLAAQFVPGPGAGEAAARGFEAMLGMARGHADASGGMAAPRGYDPAQYPMLGAYGRAGMPGLPGGPPLGNQWIFGQGGPGIPGGPPGAMPAPAAGMPAGGPNAIGLGAIGNVPAPGGPGPMPGPVPLPGLAPGMAPGPVPLPGMAPGAAPGPVPLPGPAVQQSPGVPMGVRPQAFETPMGSPAAGLLRQSWAQQANPSYDPRMTGLDEDLLRTGFDPDVIGMVLGRAM